MEKGAILIVDDEEDILLSLQMFLSIYFEQVDIEQSPKKIPSHFTNNDYDLVLLDMNFKQGDTDGEEGLYWMAKIQELSSRASIIAMTAYAEVAIAVKAVKLGAIDFIEKPWRNEKLLATVISAFNLSKSKNTIADLRIRQKSLQENVNPASEELIGQSSGMQQLFKLIEKVSATDANVLILGENGTGKELVARAIHKQSVRASNSFIKVDLGAIAESLFESELFGHKKGAFTDAKEDRMGHFELANQGSLFLDEIGNLNLSLQSKLLSALQNRQIIRLGSNRQIPIDIRLICATNMPLNQMVNEHKFRQDLLYRINTVVIQLPPLRDRRSDIPLLAHHFLKFFKQKYQKPRLQISSSTLKKLQEYAWPGNIRELRHAIERAVILSENDDLIPTDFISRAEEGNSLEDAQLESYNLEKIERWAIQKVMIKHGGNISKAADELGLTRATLYRRLEKYEL